MSNDGSMMFDQGSNANSVGSLSLESGFSAGSFEFLDDGSEMKEKKKK